MHCTCHNPVWKCLEGTLLKEEATKQLSDSMGEKDEPVSVMYIGGTIRPVKDGKMDTVEAIGFHDGQVVALGCKTEVSARMNGLGIEYAQVVLRDGHTLLPGFIEPHVHIVPTAMTMAWNDFGPFHKQDLRKDYGTEWLTKKIQCAGESLCEGYWILGQGVDPSLMPFCCIGDLNTLQSFNSKHLDDICSKANVPPKVPLMMVSASGHTAYVNTKAIKRIYKKNEKINTKYKTWEEFRQHVDEQGGLQELEEINCAISVIPKEQKDEITEVMKPNLKKLFKKANKRGVTLMYDAGMTCRMKCFLLDSFEPTVRIGYAQLCETVDDTKNLAWYTEPQCKFENFYQGSVKLVSDGSNQGITGYQNEPYRCYPEDNIGFFNFPPHSIPCRATKEYKEMVKNIARKGWPMMIHANGDKAIDLAIEVYSEILGGRPHAGLEKRHRIEHCSLLNKENLQKMSHLGISPSFLIGHVGYWGYVFKNAIFEEKAEQLDLCKSALDEDMCITLHSDNSVTPLGPLRMMEQAITRIMEKDGTVLNECEKISAEQALKAVTYDAAWQCHADQWVGSLEEGKMADYVILEEDPITRKNPVGMRNIPVLETWVGGVRVHHNKKQC